MPRGKLSDAQPIPPPQGGKANLSDTTDVGSASLGQEPLKFSAPLKADWTDILSGNPGMMAVGVSNSIPWLKEKGYHLANWEANQLPNVAGIGGGLAGGAIGEAIDPAGGAALGALPGSALGGSAGEVLRQFVRHQTGLDKYDNPKTKTVGHRVGDVAKEGAGQLAGELLGMGTGALLRPTLERAIAKLYYAGHLKYGDPLGPGDLQKVMNDLIDTEKSTGKSTTVRDFINVINKTKEDIGQEVDRKMAIPIKQNGKVVMLGQAHADSTPIVNAINTFLTSDPSIVKIASLKKAGKEAAQLQAIRDEALLFSQHPWTYAELTDRRIHLNEELAPLYALPKGEQRVHLLNNPDLAFKKAEAEAIRDIIYPTMDRLSSQPIGTTAALQGKRGALMSLENQVTDHLGELKTKALQAKGAPMTEKANVSTYGTSSGKPGFAVHRITRLIHTPNVERQANKKVAQAFGNTVGTKIRGAVSSPLGIDRLGDEILSTPARILVEHINDHFDPHEQDDSNNAEDPNGPQSSVSSPKELKDRAKQMNPSAQGQVAYTHTAVNPSTGHRVGSQDGQEWFDIQTGQKVA